MGGRTRQVVSMYYKMLGSKHGGVTFVSIPMTVGGAVALLSAQSTRERSVADVGECVG